MRIDVVSDTVCPWCYVGKRRMEGALAQRPELQFDVYWHPFQLAPDIPQEGVDRQRYYREKFGDGGRIQTMMQQLTSAGEDVGLDFAFDDIKIQPNTLRSHALIGLGSGAQQSDIKEAVLRAFFVEGKDIGDIDLLCEIGVGCGLDEGTVRAGLTDATGLAEVTRHAEAARGMGVTGVPTFIFEQQQAFSGAQEERMFLQVIDTLSAAKKPASSATAT